MSATEMLCPKCDGLTHHLVPDGREMRCAYCSSTQAQIEAQNVPQRLREQAPNQTEREPSVMSLTTQTGMPIRDCDVCGRAHPVGREHCVSCGRASAFITPAGACLKCQGGPEPVRFEPPLTMAEADAFWNAITDQTESHGQES